MAPQVRALLDRLARDRAFADDYFADPEPLLAGMDLDPADRAALAGLDRQAVEYMAVAPSIEPSRTPEYGGRAAPRRGPTVLIAVWVCVAWVLLWLLAGRP